MTREEHKAFLEYVMRESGINNIPKDWDDGLTQAEYDFTEMSYKEVELPECLPDGRRRVSWILFTKDNRPIRASRFFVYNKDHKRFSGFEGTNLYEFCEWVCGHKLVATGETDVVNPAWKYEEPDKLWNFYKLV